MDSNPDPGSTGISSAPRRRGPIGLVVCRCGLVMDDLADIGALERALANDPRIAWIRTVEFACQEGATRIARWASADPVLVAACAADHHGVEIADAAQREGLPPGRLELVDLRGPGHSARTRTMGTRRAIDLITSVLESVDAPERSPAQREVLVIGESHAGARARALLERAGRPAIAASADRIASIEGTLGRYAIGLRDGTTLGCGVVLLAFDPVARRSTDALRFQPAAALLDLTRAEELLAADDPEAPWAKGDLEDVAIVTECLAGEPSSAVPGVALERALGFVFELRERCPGSRLVLYHGSPAGGTAASSRLMDRARREAGLVTVRAAVHRAIARGGRSMVLATDRDLGKRICLAADLLVVDFGRDADGELARLAELFELGPASTWDPDAIATRRPGILVASGPFPLTPDQSLLRGAACAALCADLLHGRSP